MNQPRVHLSGNLAGKPKLKTVETVAGAVVVASLRVAVTPRRKDRAGEWSDGETMWFNVSTWRNAATNCAATLDQGDRVVVTGELSQRTWTDAEGREHVSFEVRADDVALDLSRSAAIVVRRTAPAQRQEDDRWASTGQVDEETESVVMSEGGEPVAG